MLPVVITQTVFATLPISLLGSILNWCVFYSIFKLSSFNVSFGYLSANQALADALHSTTCLLYFCPMVLLDQSFMKSYSHHCGFILLFFYDLSVMTHFAISINRLFAAWAPYHYENLFSLKNTQKIIGILWIFTGLLVGLFYQKLCNFYYDEQTNFFTITETELCFSIGWYGEFLKNSAIIAITVCFDLLTVLRIRQMRKRVRIIGETQNKFSARDIRFLKQTIFQGSVFMLELLTYFFIPMYFENHWIVFFGTSFAWVAIHAADGMIVIVCNPEIRRFLLCKTLNNQQSAAS